MYEKFFNFKSKPFNATPDTSFFYPSTKHVEALNSLSYAILEKKGFVVITGEIGAGKTTVCRHLLNSLDENIKVALITNTHLTCKELIKNILEEYEVPYKPATKLSLRSQLNEHLIKELKNGVIPVLIIDEAQNLSFKALEEVRMLSNLETETEKLIQIILIGQPNLRIKLNHQKLEQFKQRIALYYHLPPLSLQETQEYINHRLKVVSSNGSSLFSGDAVDLVFDYTKGLPRLINLICDSALLSCYIKELKQVTKELVSEAIGERAF